VLVAHHTNKLSRGKNGRVEASSGRGSSAVVDGARWQCALAVEQLEFDTPEERGRFGEIVTFSVTKSNYAAKPEPILLRRDQDNGGALLPVSDADRTIVDEGREAATPRGAKTAARQSESQRRDQGEDVAVLRAVLDEEGLSVHKLVPKVRAIAGACSSDRAMVAIARVAPFLDVRHGPRGSRLHYRPKSGTKLPDHLETPPC
jgi:hypothetical protein